MKPQDIKATEIRFGIELETAIPAASGITVGSYHGGRPVTGGLRLNESTILAAPSFNRAKWSAERDGSIRCQPGEMACEFVSPILHGEAGVAGMCDFVGWLNGIGARVNDSCGCHVTVSVDSVIGASDAQARADFARKLAHIAQWHARAIYGQTGTGRHLNSYSHTFAEDVAKLVKQMQHDADVRRKEQAAVACGRGMVNFRKLFSHGLVEFRAFAGTVNLAKVQHHVGTALGLCRRAHEVQCLGGFTKNKLQQSRTRNAAESVQFLWDYLGWTGSNRPVALGLFGRLHADFANHSREALRLCRQFDGRYADANL
ncbi:MAG: amidoligase family protein [Verrucomicrobiota bacterium]